MDGVELYTRQGVICRIGSLEINTFYLIEIYIRYLPYRQLRNEREQKRITASRYLPYRQLRNKKSIW